MTFTLRYTQLVAWNANILLFCADNMSMLNMKFEKYNIGLSPVGPT